MMRSQVLGERKEVQSIVSLTRTSKTGWLQESFDPVIARLTARITRITGLRADTWRDESELLQVANYINGGHYSPHHDYVLKDKDPNHVRIRQKGHKATLRPYRNYISIFR